MVFLSGLVGPFVLGTSGSSVSAAGLILKPIALFAFAAPMAGTMPLTIIAASL